MPDVNRPEDVGAAALGHSIGVSGRLVAMKASYEPRAAQMPQPLVAAYTGNRQSIEAALVCV